MLFAEGRQEEWNFHFMYGTILHNKIAAIDPPALRASQDLQTLNPSSPG